MKKVIFFLIITTLLSFSIYAQESKGEWKWFIIDNFEECYNWPVINTRTAQPEYYYRNPRLAVIPGAPKGLQDSPKNNVMGIKILRIGSKYANEVFVTPILPIHLPGVCKKVSFWVNGRNKNLIIKVRFSNYFNGIYTLEPEPSSLQFFGWKEMVIDNIDQKIPQIDPNRLDYRPMKILAFIIENQIGQESFKPFYVYFDQIKAYCNEFTLPSYDGSEIKDTW
ncbi:MAG: hypothetical protein JW827_10815 [Spirochaetes bacterium]|nr:hypothetical protein [Spirochaetota bacterium]